MPPGFCQPSTHVPRGHVATTGVDALPGRREGAEGQTRGRSRAIRLGDAIGRRRNAFIALVALGRFHLAGLGLYIQNRPAIAQIQPNGLVLLQDGLQQLGANCDVLATRVEFSTALLVDKNVCQGGSGDDAFGPAHKVIGLGVHNALPYRVRQATEALGQLFQ